MEGKIQLSVAIITKNEAERLPECLKSISFAEDIVVVDSGSTDKTLEILNGFGCRVFVEEWKGYGPQKNSAVQKCKYDWVLILDADERIPEEASAEILRIMNSSNRADAYRFPRKSFFHGKWIRCCGWWPDRQTRLVRKSKGQFHSIVHESWVTTGSVKNLEVCLKHYPFDNYSAMLRKLDEYSSLSAEELYRQGARASFLKAFLYGLAMFLRCYVAKKGILDGLDGFAISLTKAGGSLFKYAKLIELQRNHGGGA